MTSYNLDLTKELDNIKGCFDQYAINKIALWKLNRYPDFTGNLIMRLNKIRNDNIGKKIMRSYCPIY
jgi:hypothetical protein